MHIQYVLLVLSWILGAVVKYTAKAVSADTLVHKWLAPALILVLSAGYISVENLDALKTGVMGGFELLKLILAYATAAVGAYEIPKNVLQAVRGSK